MKRYATARDGRLRPDYLEELYWELEDKINWFGKRRDFYE